MSRDNYVVVINCYPLPRFIMSSYIYTLFYPFNFIVNLHISVVIYLSMVYGLFVLL